MKKIVSAALVGAMVAGAFAADAKITLNYRTKLDAFALTKTETGDNKATVKEWLDWEGYDGAGAQGATSASDGFKFVLNGEKAGATFATNVSTNAKTSKDAALFTLVEYSAWMKWELGPGELKVGSGNWKDGYADGNYRVKKDVDAQNAEGMDFERFKLGTILKGTNKLTFIDDLANGANNTALFSYADYGFDATEDLKFNILLGSNYAAFDKVVDADDATDTTTTYYDAFFVSRVQAKMNGVFDAELIFKKPAPHVTDFGLYVMPKVLDGLTLNIGGAMEIDNHDTDNGGYKDWAFDLRARYQATDELSLTLFTNISGTDLEAGRTIASGIVGHKGSEGWATSVKAKTAMWNNLSARYKINDSLAATLNVGLINALSLPDTDKNDYGMEWRVTPAIQVYAGSNASIWGGIALSGTSATVSDVDQSKFALQIPVIFRVKM